MDKKEIEELEMKLRQKGWNEEEIKKVIEVYSEEKDQGTKRFFMIVIYWLALLVTIIANFLVSVIVLLFIFTLPTYILYPIIAIVAFGFGELLLLLLRDIKQIDPKHYVIISIFFPAMAFVNVFIITSVTNFIKNLSGAITPNAMIISLVYVYAFSSPYLYLLLKEGFQEEEEIKKHVIGRA